MSCIDNPDLNLNHLKDEVTSSFQQIHSFIPFFNQKYLNRPPLKFIFMIVVGLQKKYGFGKGVFKPEDGCPNERESKYHFFETLVKYTGLISDQVIDVNIKHICNGTEVEKTLKFLLQIHEAAKNPTISFENAAKYIISEEEMPIGTEEDLLNKYEFEKIQDEFENIQDEFEKIQDELRCIKYEVKKLKEEKITLK